VLGWVITKKGINKLCAIGCHNTMTVCRVQNLHLHKHFNYYLIIFAISLHHTSGNKLNWAISFLTFDQCCNWIYSLVITLPKAQIIQEAIIPASACRYFGNPQTPSVMIDGLQTRKCFVSYFQPACHILNL
jgi:hypothetical protein